MKFLMMGAGSIGERHLKNLKAIMASASIDVFDPQYVRLTEVCKKHGAHPVKEDAIESRYDCVFVCTPPSSHTSLARKAVSAGSNVFIEKPLSSGLKGIDGLAAVVSRKKALAFVGYNFRFNKGLAMVKKMINEQKFGRIVHAQAYFGQYLPDWRPLQDYRKSYTANKKLGGGIIHDGSHEIDYLVWILGRPSSVQSQFAHTKTLDTDTEAMADILLKFGDVPANVHLDYVRREYRRSAEFLCENGMIQWSLSEDAVRTLDASKLWSITRVNENVNDMYVAEVSHVVECVKLGQKSDIIDLENGISTLQISAGVHKAGITGRRLSL